MSKMPSQSSIRAIFIGAVGVVGLGLLLFLAEFDGDDPRATGVRTVQVAVGRAADGITGLVARQPEPLPPEVPDTIPSLATAPESSLPRLEVGSPESVPEGQVWDELYGSLGALMNGTMTQDQLLSLGFGLIAQLDPEATPVVVRDGEAVAYNLMSDPSLGDVTLYIALDAARKAVSATDFEVEASLYTRPGAFTGEPQDGAARSRMSFTLNVDSAGAPTHVGANCQNLVHHTPDLWKMLNSRTGAAAIGGAFNVGPDAAKWYQATIEAGGTVDKPSFTSTSSEPIEMPGTITDPRVVYMTSVLEGLRNSAVK